VRSTPTMRALTSQSRVASVPSRASGAGSTTLPSSKYFPVTPSRSGLAASWTMRSPPFSALMKNGRNAIWMIGLAHRGAPDQMFVSTEPGCRLLEVTPVPARRRASSLAKRTLASLERPYARMIE